MSNVTDFRPEIQQRISRFTRNLKAQGFSRPEAKNIGCLLYGMLKSPGVQLAGISRAQDERITQKKTWERLNRTLRRKGLGEKLIDLNLREREREIARKRYCVIDLSDIQKPYAQEMDGLSRVRDGDAGKGVIGNGYWWLNAVMADRDGILPVYGEIYSLDYEGRAHTSENSKILSVIDPVHVVHPKAIYVIDRGGDRYELLQPMIESGKRFVIRGDAKRSLSLRGDSGRTWNIKEIAKQVECHQQVRSSRGEMFMVGIRRVYLKGSPLWLVVSSRRTGGLCWYLTNVEGGRTTVMKTVMEGYGYRWRVEEYHRQIKQDYSLEDIRLRTYTAIKNMAVLVMLTASFLAALPRSLAIMMIAEANLLVHKSLGDIPDYWYYMITAAVVWVLASSVKRSPLPLRIQNYFQLELNLEAP
jgi:hypothetical protein